MGFALPEDAKPEQRLAVLHEWLATNQDWLLLVDNVDDVDFIHNCKFNKPNGKVIYTSNDDKIFRFAMRVQLPKLSEENAMLLLYKHWQDDAEAKFEDIPGEAHPALKGIAKKFGNHPFSMAFVGSYLAEEDESLEEFLEAYQSKEKNLLEKYKFLSGYQHENVATAFLLRFEQISTPKDGTEREQFLSIAVKDYLKLSAFVGTDNIPEELLQQALAKLHPDQVAWTESKEFIKDIYKRFKPTSIFKRDAENKTLTTHRIVQEIMCFQVKEEEILILETLAEILADHFELFDFYNKEKVERFLSHVGSLLVYLQESFRQYQKINGQVKVLSSKDKFGLSLENKTIAKLCSYYARYFYQNGQYIIAERYCEYFKSICERLNDVSQILLAESYNNLALLYKTQSKYEQSESLYLKAKEIREKELGENHPSTATTYNDLANLYNSLKKYEESEKFHLKVKKIYEEILGLEHSWTATSYSNLGGLYLIQGRYEEAKSLYITAKNINEKVFGENHPDTASSYLGLGVLFYDEGNSQEGLKLCEKALKIFQNTLPADHPDIQNCEDWVKAIKNSIYK